MFLFSSVILTLIEAEGAFPTPNLPRIRRIRIQPHSNTH